jgi:hypothetical protein
MWTIFTYLYRDASNYKAFGRIALKGILSSNDRHSIVEKFEGGDLFVAAQIGVPVLNEQLYHRKNGPTIDDHCWHEFEGFEESASPPDPSESPVWGRASDFLAEVSSVSGWDGELSPHFKIDQSSLREMTLYPPIFPCPTSP